MKRPEAWIICREPVNRCLPNTSRVTCSSSSSGWLTSRVTNRIGLNCSMKSGTGYMQYRKDAKQESTGTCHCSLRKSTRKSTNSINPARCRFKKGRSRWRISTGWPADGNNNFCLTKDLASAKSFVGLTDPFLGEFYRK